MDEIQDRPQYCIEEIKELESRAEDFMDTLDETVDYAIKKAKGADDLAQAFEYLSELTYTTLLTMGDALAPTSRNKNSPNPLIPGT